MIALSIEDIKLCMNGLLRESVFDDFLFHSLELVTLFRMEMDGKRQESYLNEVEREEQDDETYVRWKQVRPLVRDLVKSFRTPLVLEVNFILSDASKEKVLRTVPENLRQAVGAFSFRLRFESGALRLITATNYKGFLPDKSAEHQFDDSMKQFLSYYGYVFHQE